MTVDISQTGDLSENYPFAAFSPSGSKLYVFENNRGSDIREYTYPGLSEVGIVVNDVLGPMACDGSGVLYWTDSEIVGTDVSCVIYKDPSSPTEIMRWTSTSSLPIVSICWSPFDDSIYALVNLSVSPFTDEGLWRIDLDGATSDHVESSFSIDTAVNTPVPTLDGAIWWSNPSPTRVYRHDITGGTTAQAIADFFDVVIPQPDHSVIGWSTIAGVSKGRRIDAAMSITDETDVNVLTPGQRGVAYIPDLTCVAVERRLSGEVWQIGQLPTGGWTVGRVAWGSKGAWR